jgi:hypothetical protein
LFQKIYILLLFISPVCFWILVLLSTESITHFALFICRIASICISTNNFRLTRFYLECCALQIASYLDASLINRMLLTALMLDSCFVLLVLGIIRCREGLLYMSSAFEIITVCMENWARHIHLHHEYMMNIYSENIQFGTEEMY